MKKLIAIPALCGLLLTGCATTLEQPRYTTKPEPEWFTNQQLLSKLTSWSVKGKIGVKTGNKGGSATLLWKYNDQTQNIDLSGPFGGGRVVIEANANGASLSDTGGETIKAASVVDVLYQKLGWHIPFDQLIYWSRGLPNPTATNIMTDGQGRLRSLVHSHWSVEYLGYQAVEGLQLPRKLELTALPGQLQVYAKNGEYLGDDFRVRVILKLWSDLEFEP